MAHIALGHSFEGQHIGLSANGGGASGSVEQLDVPEGDPLAAEADDVVV